MFSRIFQRGAEGQRLQRIQEDRQRALHPHCQSEHIQSVNTTLMIYTISFSMPLLRMHLLQHYRGWTSVTGSFYTALRDNIVCEVKCDMMCRISMLQWKVGVMTSRNKQWLLFIDFSWRTEETLWDEGRGRKDMFSVSIKGSMEVGVGEGSSVTERTWRDNPWPYYVLLFLYSLVFISSAGIVLNSSFCCHSVALNVLSLILAVIFIMFLWWKKMNKTASKFEYQFQIK